MHAPAPDVVVSLRPDDLHAILDARAPGNAAMLDAVRGALEIGVKEAVQLASPRSRVIVRWDPDGAWPRVWVRAGSDTLRPVVLSAIDGTVQRVRATLRRRRPGADGPEWPPVGERADLGMGDPPPFDVDDGWRAVMRRHPTTLEMPAVPGPAPRPWWDRRRAPRR